MSKTGTAPFPHSQRCDSAIQTPLNVAHCGAYPLLRISSSPLSCQREKPKPRLKVAGCVGAAYRSSIHQKDKAKGPTTERDPIVQYHQNERSRSSTAADPISDSAFAILAGSRALSMGKVEKEL